MPSAWRARLFAGRPGGGSERSRGPAPDRASRAAQQPIEHSILLTATLCLLAAGAVMVYSASSAPSVLQGQGNGTGYLVRFAAYGAIGLVVMRYFARAGLEAARRLTGPLLMASFVLVLAVHIPHIGVQVNGARRWIGAGPLQFQPSELMKLALVLYTAELLARRPQRALSLRELIRPLLLVVGAGCLLVVTQPDLGTALVIAFTTGALLVAAGMPLRNLALLAGAGLSLMMLYALVQPYSRARLTSFLHPWSHAGSTGFQAVQGQIAIGSGGLFGVGPGQSVQKIFYLPEAQTDFILAVIGEELGIVGVCGLLFLYGMVAFAGLRAAKAARSLHSALVAVGVTALILSQAVLNVFAVLGLAPLTGVPLPFISYGSSSLIVMLAGMGLLLNVASGQTAHLRAVGRRAPTARGKPAAEKPAKRRPAAASAPAPAPAPAPARERRPRAAPASAREPEPEPARGRARPPGHARPEADGRRAAQDKRRAAPDRPRVGPDRPRSTPDGGRAVREGARAMRDGARSLRDRARAARDRARAAQEGKRPPQRAPAPARSGRSHGGGFPAAPDQDRRARAAARAAARSARASDARSAEPARWQDGRDADADRDRRRRDRRARRAGAGGGRSAAG